MRNLGRTRRRSERRRAAREASLVQHGVSPSAYEVVERFAAQSRAVDALRGLDEPYRSTLLLRYFDGLSQREIAERTGVPISTVGTRLAEGLGRLRRKVRRRESWLASLIAVSFGREGAPAPAALVGGTMLMTVRVTSIVLLVLLLGGFLWLQSTEPSDSPAAEVLPASRAVAVDPGPGTARAAAETERVVVASGEAPTRAPSFADIPAHAGLEFGTVRGRVVDLSASPLAGVEVGCARPGLGAVGSTPGASRSTRTTRTDAAGRFAIEGALPMECFAVDSRYATVFGGVARTVDGPEVVVVVGRPIPLAGVVVDEAGVPFGGAVLAVLGAVEVEGVDLGRSAQVRPRVLSDESGRFRFEGLAALEGMQLHVQAPGFAPTVLDVPPGGDRSLEIVLPRESEARYAITGEVVFEDGSPVEGAYVTTGVMASRSDARGRFVIDCEPWLSRVDPEAPTLLTAVLPGRQSAQRTLPSQREMEEGGRPEQIRLEIGGVPRTIDGVVVDADGRPVPGVLVEPVEMTEFGLIPSERMPAYGVPTTLELLSGGGTARTDAEGRFVVSGLLERSYSLRVLDRQSLLAVSTAPVDAGTRALRVVYDLGRLGTIAGRIVDRTGAGIEGVRIAVSGRRTGELVIGRSVTTDASGAFRLERVTLEPEFLRIEGEAIVPELFREPDPGADLGALVLPVGRRCRVQFDWSGWAVAGDEVRVVDRDGDPLMMMRVTAGRIGERPALRTERGGRSEVVLVSDAAAQIVVTREGEEVSRLRLGLRGDELNVVRL